MSQSLFPLKRNGKRQSDGGSEHIARVGWLLLRLLLDRTVEYAAYRDHFGRSKRGFQRDLRKLRQIGEGYFTISRSKSGRAFLTTHNTRLSNLNAHSRDAATTLARIASALGGPLQQTIINSSKDAALAEGRVDMTTGFLHVREPLPAASDRVTKLFDFLKNAAAGPARVEFEYLAKGTRTLRRVEPYHVIARSGRYYLIAYDLVRRDWRHFALDSIEDSTLRKEGTFTPRPVPETLLAERAVGWIRTNRRAEVTIRLSPLVAAAVRARQWQKEQRMTPLRDGGAEITLTVDDIAEAVRWALQFGPEAAVLAPPEAVALAHEMAEQIVRIYEKLRQPGVARAV